MPQISFRNRESKQQDEFLHNKRLIQIFSMRISLENSFSPFKMTFKRWAQGKTRSAIKFKQLFRHLNEALASDADDVHSDREVPVEDDW